MCASLLAWRRSTESGTRTGSKPRPGPSSSSRGGDQMEEGVMRPTAENLTTTRVLQRSNGVCACWFIDTYSWWGRCKAVAKCVRPPRSACSTGTRKWWWSPFSGRILYTAVTSQRKTRYQAVVLLLEDAVNNFPVPPRHHFRNFHSSGSHEALSISTLSQINRFRRIPAIPTLSRLSSNSPIFRC